MLLKLLHEESLRLFKATTMNEHKYLSRGACHPPQDRPSRKQPNLRRGATTELGSRPADGARIRHTSVPPLLFPPMTMMFTQVLNILKMKIFP